MITQPTLGEATRVWWRIGLLSFGGPAGQIALMHKEVVESKRWLSEQQFLNALSFCMLLPGPEAMQLATYSGWRLHGTRGGLIAGLLFILPGAVVMMALAILYSTLGNVPLVSALFFGIKAAVLVVVVEALLRVSRKALQTTAHWIIALLAFIGIFFMSLPFPLIVLAAGLIGFVMSSDVTESDIPDTKTVSLFASLKTVALWLAIWLLPLLALGVFGAPAIVIDVGQFFSTLAVVTFGGAYAVLAYMVQDVVVQFNWLEAGEMVDALGLAETTPGPLILVTQFVGFLAGANAGGVWLGLAAAMVALWVTFAPCFLWIFVGAPYIEWISSRARLRGALTAVTAAVVGVILNLSLWFAMHVLFAEVNRIEFRFLTLWWVQPSSVQWLSLGLFILSCVLAFRLHWGIIKILAVVSVLGAALHLVTA